MDDHAYLEDSRERIAAWFTIVSVGPRRAEAITELSIDEIKRMRKRATVVATPGHDPSPWAKRQNKSLRGCPDSRSSARAIGRRSKSPPVSRIDGTSAAWLWTPGGASASS